MAEPSSAEVKLLIAKLIEVAYSTDKGMTTKIVLEKGAFKLTLDEAGNAELTGKAGPLRFTGGPTLRKMGITLSRLTVDFQGDENGDVTYTAGVGVGKTIGIRVHGKFNIIDLIQSCSGLLCTAARFLNGGAHPAVDEEFQRHMGHY